MPKRKCTHLSIFIILNINEIIFLFDLQMIQKQSANLNILQAKTGHKNDFLFGNLKKSVDFLL